MRDEQRSHRRCRAVLGRRNLRKGALGILRTDRLALMFEDDRSSLRLISRGFVAGVAEDPQSAVSVAA